MENEVNAEINK